MDWFWHAIFICLVVIPATILWVVAIFDIVFRRHDLRPVSRILLLLMVLLIPVLGALLYFGTSGRPRGPAGDYEGDYTGRGDQREPVQYQRYKAV